MYNIYYRYTTTTVNTQEIVYHNTMELGLYTIKLYIYIYKYILFSDKYTQNDMK